MSKEYITTRGQVSEADLMQCIAAYQSKSTCAYAIWSGRFQCTRQFAGEDIAKLQELRIFDETREFRARRQGKVFLWRVIDDVQFKAKLASEPDAFLRDYKNRVMEECHYLDIDSEKTKTLPDTQYAATGGGIYTLPEQGLERIVLRNYLDYDEDGIVQVADFRLVQFEKGE